MPTSPTALKKSAAKSTRAPISDSTTQSPSLAIPLATMMRADQLSRASKSVADSNRAREIAAAPLPSPTSPSPLCKTIRTPTDNLSITEPMPLESTGEQIKPCAHNGQKDISPENLNAYLTALGIHSVKPVVPLVVSGLTNPIHPILHSSQFMNPDNFLLPGVELSLRLVSRYFTLDTFVKHIVVMVDGEIRSDTQLKGGCMEASIEELLNLKDDQGQPLNPNFGRYPKAHHETVDETMRERAAEILNELKDLVRFQSQNLPENIFGATMAPCPPYSWLTPYKEFEPANLPRASRIGISSLTLQKVAALQSRYDKGRKVTDVEKDLHMQQVSLANTIYHELFHAVDNAYNRPRSRGASETFYGDCKLAECGHAAEAALFGGVLQLLPACDRLADPSIGWDGTAMQYICWPGWEIYDTYKAKKRFGVRFPQPDNSEELYCPVPHWFVDALLTDEYWEKEGNKSGQSTLMRGPRRVKAHMQRYSRKMHRETQAARLKDQQTQTQTQTQTQGEFSNPPVLKTPKNTRDGKETLSGSPLCAGCWQLLR